MLEIFLSFLEGLALIVSPCILPVLPLILASSVDGGKKRPFGIIIGFVLSFTLLAMLSRKLIMIFNIDLDYIKYGSLALLTIFGLVLISSTLSAKFSALTNSFANAGNTITASAKEGFFSGIFIGFLIGIVWTPCAGPILAAVLVQVIRQQNDLAGLFIIASFALGAAVPMLIIALTGRKIMNKLGFFTTYAEAVRKFFGVIILIAVAFIASGVDASTLFSKNDAPTNSTQESGLKDVLPNPYPAPEFAGIDSWLNSKALTMESLKGKVVLIDFWTYSCINCVRTLPYITQWDKKYRDKGLVIIGVHSPEFEFEKNKANVQSALTKHGIKYPVALDNRLDTWTAFSNKYWPAHYLIDKNGNVVYTHFGEGHYSETENNIRILLGINESVVSDEDNKSENSNIHITPETYLGYQRSKNFTGKEGAVINEMVDFKFPKFLPADHWALSGAWKIEGQNITSLAPAAGLQLNFTAKKVFLVLGSASGKSISVKLSLNGEVLGNELAVKDHTLYELVDQQTVKNSLLEITAGDAGLEAYAFTFGE